MPDSTQPKTPPVEPHTESTPKESIRVAQEEFVGDEATPSRDRSEVSGHADRGAESSDVGVEDGQLPGADSGAQSSDRAVEDASLSNRMTAEAGTETADPDEEDDDDLLADDEDDEDLDDEEDEDLDADVAEEELTDDETEATPGAMRAFAGV